MRRFFKKYFNFKNIVFIALAVYLIVLMVEQQSTLSRTEVKNRELKADIAQTESDIAKLEEEREILDTEEYIEEKAREILGYVKSGETVYIKVQG